ncbi:hypothetical protein L1049_021295 [Liquidambar formosana]|uniref:Uncharacterized protein n=1 Tax=Liquidambar formosana TaxID=63359 RepID=A0AAP0XAS1_LIQFO
MTKLCNLYSSVALLLASSIILVEPGLAFEVARPAPLEHDIYMDLLLDSSDSNSNSSNDELEIMVIVALQQELLNVDRRSRRRRGSIQGHTTKRRDRIERHNRLYKDYFVENPVYSPIDFRRRFQMRRSLFL